MTSLSSSQQPFLAAPMSLLHEIFIMVSFMCLFPWPFIVVVYSHFIPPLPFNQYHILEGLPLVWLHSSTPSRRALTWCREILVTILRDSHQVTIFSPFTLLYFLLFLCVVSCCFHCFLLCFVAVFHTKEDRPRPRISLCPPPFIGIGIKAYSLHPFL